MSAGGLASVSQPGRRMIEARDVYRSFGQTPALQGASLAVAPGEIVAVTGAERIGQVHAVALPGWDLQAG